MNKKILLIIILLVVVLVIAGYLGFNYYKEVNKGEDIQENLENDTSSDIIDNPVQIQDIQVNNDGDNPRGLLVCVDACGDGVCQRAGDPCGDAGNLNCSCAETPQDCPQDCK